MMKTKKRKIIIQGFEWQYTPYYLGDVPYVPMSEIDRLYKTYGNKKIREELDCTYHNLMNHPDFICIHQLSTFRGVWGDNSKKYPSAPIVLNPDSDEHFNGGSYGGWAAYCMFLNENDMFEFTHSGKTQDVKYLPDVAMIVEDMVEQYLKETPSDISLLEVASDEELLKDDIITLKRQVAYLMEELSNVKEKMGGY